MKFIVDTNILTLFPSLRIGVMHGVLTGPASACADLDKLETLRVSSLAKLKTAFQDVKSLEGDARIELWKNTYKKMGVNPKKVKPTHWALASRLVKDGHWPRPIGPVIDVYLVNQM
jgi:DNA/RNA-binding domain of Phe-tRNA-synthetase-like protein